MAIGTVKLWDGKLGFGFIKQPAGHDVFIHAEALRKRKIEEIGVGDTVDFDITKRYGKAEAANVTIIKQGLGEVYLIGV